MADAIDKYNYLELITGSPSIAATFHILFLDIWRSLLDVPDHEHRVLRGRDASIHSRQALSVAKNHIVALFLRFEVDIVASVGFIIVHLLPIAIFIVFFIVIIV